MLKNNKGFSLVELLITLMVIGIISTLVTAVFIFALQSYNTSTNQISQHDKVIDAIQRIRKDVNEAYAYNVVNSTTSSALGLHLKNPVIPDKTWILGSEKLYLKYGTDPEAEVLAGIDTELTSPAAIETRISIFKEIDDKTLLFSIKPVNTNTTIHKNRNVNNPIITEFSVQYKTDTTIP